MNYATKAIFVEYFRSQKLLYDIRNSLSLFFLTIRGEKVPTGIEPAGIEPEPLIESIKDEAKKLKFDQARFKRLLTRHINALTAGRKPTKTLENLIRSHCEGIRDEISNIPNTLDKARASLLALIEVDGFLDTDQVCDAMVFLSDRIHPQFVTHVVDSWKEEEKKYRERYKDTISFIDHIFWTSRDFMEDLDGISRYRFREHFDIGEFEQAFKGVEETSKALLTEACFFMEDIHSPIHGDEHLTRIAYELWLVSRSRRLVNRLKDRVDMILRVIARWQHDAGWWSGLALDSSGKRQFLPDTYTTALFSLDILKLSDSRSRSQQGVLGAKWLLGKQDPDGSWSRGQILNRESTLEPDIFTSLLALEALVRSGIENIDHSIKQGIEWIMQQQNELGMWEDKAFPFPFLTVLVLEFLESKDFLPTKLKPYQSMSKGLINRSIQLSLEDGVDSYRLAIIAAFHGIEAFLYSVLDDPKVNIKIFTGANETIGMRKALIQFQTYLQDEDKIKRNEVISHRNSLDRLAYVRDQIVHKAIGVDQEECRHLVDKALRFMAKYSLEIFGFDIFA